LLLLVAVWAVGLVYSFALVFWGLQPRLPAAVGSPTFGTLVYLSGETFFTLGYGDLAPLDASGRIVAVIEVGTGFTFLALIIGYLPVIYQGFSRRELNITLLDARAGSPPSATELLRRMATPLDPLAIEQFLQEWERWAAEAYFARRGGIAIVLTRCVLTPIAVPVNLVAGSSAYPVGRFAAYAVSGEVIWLLGYGAIGYFFGSQWETISALIGHASVPLAGVLITGGAAYALVRWQRHPRPGSSCQQSGRSR
jgi:Ion channel